MWNLVHAARSRARSCPPGTVSFARSFPVVPTRSYATSKSAGSVKIGRQGFRGKKGESRALEPRVASRDNKNINPGAFRPMPVNQLSHPLFDARKSDGLVLPVFRPEAISTNVVGQALKFGMKENDAFRIFGLPKNVLVEFRILSQPCSIVRDATVTLVDTLRMASQQSSLNSRIVLTGRSGCGKSFLLLQSVEYCLMNGWVVFYIPRAVNLVNSTTTHIYDPRTQTYLQPVFAFQTLQRFLTVNSSTIVELQTQRELQIEKRAAIPAGTPLVDLISVGIREQALAPIILNALLEELGQQTKRPVLLAIDDFQALYCKTTYRDPHFVPIKSYHLSMPRLMMEYASGKKSFACGAILGAINSSDPLFQISSELRETLDIPDHRPTGTKTKISSVMKEYTNGLRSFSVPSELSVTEAASLFEVWMKDGAFHSSAYDELFLSKYSESSGNARDFVWKGLLKTLET